MDSAGEGCAYARLWFNYKKNFASDSLQVLRRPLVYAT
jgi:hypothetical protein